MTGILEMFDALAGGFVEPPPLRMGDALHDARWKRLLDRVGVARRRRDPAYRAAEGVSTERARAWRARQDPAALRARNAADQRAARERKARAS